MPRGYEKEDLLQEGALKWLERRDDWDSSISQLHNREKDLPKGGFFVFKGG